jgi:Ni,Fe-hydrogenase III small subunit/ferredoxin
MLRALAQRFQQKHRTIGFPAIEPTLPDRFRGRPKLDAGRCQPGCDACAEACPTGALRVADGKARLDLGRCLFCGDCEHACRSGAIQFSREYSLAARARADLEEGLAPAKLAQALDQKSRSLFGRSLRLRQVSAGGCNACEADTNVLGTVVFDLARFGVQFVASPRHADGLLVTGPVSQNMKLGLQKTWDATPAPKIVIAVGACAISGGPFEGHREVVGGADKILPVDLYVPGCPPHPITLLDGILRLLDRR